MFDSYGIFNLNDSNKLKTDLSNVELCREIEQELEQAMSQLKFKDGLYYTESPKKTSVPKTKKEIIEETTNTKKENEKEEISEDLLKLSSTIKTNNLNNDSKKPEHDYLFIKHIKCPCCDKEIEARTIKTGKPKKIRQELSLRNVYENVDTNSYEVIWCNNCGFAALSKYFKPLSSFQLKSIKENISSKYKPITYKNKLEYTFEEVKSSYQLALINCLYKKAKNSEKAYTLYKYSLVFDYYLEQENLSDKEKEELEKDRLIILQECLKGFILALEKESESKDLSTNAILYLTSYVGLTLLKEDVNAKIMFPNIEQIVASSISKLMVSKTLPAILKTNVTILKENYLELKKRG